jgi:hypothetical protein
VTALWPDAGPWTDWLSFLFVGAMLAAVGGAVLYTVWLGDRRVAGGGTIALTIIYAAMTAACIAFAADGTAGLTPWIVVFAVAALVHGGGAIVALRQPVVHHRPIPILVRIAFVIFTAVLITTGTLLILRLPNVFPWPLEPLSSVLYGCMFVGFAANYAFVAARGGIDDAKVSLVGFLIYDLILIVPFLRLFPVVAPERWLSLVVYTSVLVFSAAVTVYCFAADAGKSNRAARVH